MRYCCPNPNCNRVFSRPKIIRYYVCPSCQSLININDSYIHSHSVHQKCIKRVAKQKILEKYDVLKWREPSSGLLSVQPDKKTSLALIQSHSKTALGLIPSNKKTDLILIQPCTKTLMLKEKAPENSLSEMRKGTIIELKQESDSVIIQGPEEPQRTPFQSRVENEQSQIKAEGDDDSLTLNSEEGGNVTVSKKTDEAVANSDSSVKKCSRYFGYLFQRAKGEKIPETCFECSNLVACLMSETDNSAIEEIEKC